MNKDQIKQDIIKMLAEKGSSVSFIELERIQGFSGNANMEVGNKNIFIWRRCSESAITAIKSLLDDGIIELTVTTELPYHIDGFVPGLPVAKSDRTYKKPHWLPTVLNKGINYRFLAGNNLTT